MNQLTMLGGLHGETVKPIAHGDILQTKPFGRVVVTEVSDNINGPVYVSVQLSTGNTCVVLEREVMYRSS